MAQPISSPNRPAPASSTTPEKGSGLQLAQQAGARWHVPPMLLYGIYGMETGFGTNVKDSPTGAQGPMQFEPGTWAVYGHGRNVQDTAAAMDAAAEKLAHDAGPTHDWAKAVTAYGGGYTIQDVTKKAEEGIVKHLGWNKSGKSDLQNLANATGIPQAIGAVKSVGQALSDFFNTITDPRTWLHVAEVVGGGILVIMALHQLAGTPSVGDIAHHVPVPVPV